MANRLATESSPYLLQHRNNPVDWYPWGPEALERARRENCPIFLSIGYSACHWCHVMEHESFENPAIAARMNAGFVCIKVDREERPDLDQIYMHAVQLMTGRGGWPMSVFLTPDLQPFFGGTYWPPTSRGGMPGFDQVLHAVTEAWKSRREEAIEQAANLTEHLKDFGNYPATGQGLRDDLIHAAVATLERIFDATHGGFGGAPKFPHSMDLQLLLRAWRRAPRNGLLEMVRVTLDHMARGGIYDHLAGGFARYSVDARWLVPHFEKMLYDNGLLTLAYLEAFQATGDATNARIARETLDYVLSYMTDAAGGFHSTEDADSEGVEGKFYVWTPPEIREVLGPDRGARFCYVYDVTEHGNFEHGQSILHLPKPISQAAAVRGWNAQELAAELADSRARLLAVRDARVRPGKDDKILVSWNALMIDALARASGLLDGGRRYRDAAVRAADFLWTQLRRPDGRLWHAWRHGQARFDAYLDDYAYLANAFVSLYEATFDERWLDAAVELVEQMVRHFADRDAGGFYFTADDHEQLIARPKDVYDSSVPSGNAMAATVLARLGKLLGRDEYVELARGTLDIAMGLMERSPTATGQMLIAADMLLARTLTVVIVGDPDSTDTAEVLSVLRRRFLPNVQVACRRPSANGLDGAGSGTHGPHGATGTTDAPGRRSPLLDPLFAGREPRPGQAATQASPAVFVCEGHTCQAPAYGRQAALEIIERL